MADIKVFENDLVEVKQLFFDTSKKALVMVLKNNDTMIGEGIFNEQAAGITDYHFVKAKLIGEMIYECTECGWFGKRSDKKEVEDDEDYTRTSKILVCPKCEHKEFYMHKPEQVHNMSNQRTER